MTQAFRNANELMSKVNLNLLYPLDAILNTRTLTEAGRRVRLTQPAMSAALKRLREQFDDDLVAYYPGDRQLTPLGHALKDVVRRALRDADHIFRLNLSFIPQTSTGTISLSAYDALETMILRTVIAELAREAPGLDFRLVPFDPAEPARALDRGADVIFLPDSLADRRLATRMLMRDRLSCMVWQYHPVLNGYDISLADYLDGRHVSVFGAPSAISATDREVEMTLKRRRIVVEVTHHSTVPTAVIGSDLIATGSSWLLQHHASILPLRVMPVPFPSQPEEIVAQWMPHRSGDPMLEWLIERVSTLLHLPLLAAPLG